MKKVIGLLLIIISGIVLIFGIIYLLKSNYITKSPTYDLEVYSKTKLYDLVKDADENMEIDTSKLGKYNLDYESNGETKRIYINVVDTTPPTVMLYNNYNHIIGTNFTIYSDTVCVDNYDKKPKCEVIGDYDLNTLGSYKVKFRASDSSNNVYERSFNLNVVEKTTPEKVYMSFEEVKERVNKEGGKLLIDVSKWEPNIDWKKVKESGIDYAFIRVGTEKYSTGELIEDPYFEKFYKEATNNGIKVGVYFFTYAKDKETILKHADFVLEHIKGKDIELGVALDWECWDLFNDMSISIHDLNDLAQAFIDKIEANGYKTLLYSSKNYLETVWKVDTDIWLAHYTKETNYKKDKLIWQFSANGIIPGIKQDVDVNVYYGN